MRPHTTLITLAVAALTSFASAQQPPAPTIQVYSRETVVDVIATDAKGQPVHDLKPSDFSVEQDHKPQSIRSFKESTAPTDRVLPKLPPNVYSNVGATPESGPVYIFVLDTLNTDATNSEILKLEMVKYLKRLPPGTQVAVFGMSLDWGGRMLQPFTSDGAKLTSAVSKFDADWVRRPLVPPEVPNQLTYKALTQIAAYAGGIKGRKNLLWFTTNMPIHVLSDGGFGEGFPPPPGVSFKQITALYDLFIEEQVAIYPVSPGGAGLISPIAIEVADATGGKAYGGSNDIQSLIGGAIENGRSFYTLSYVPPPIAADGRFHTIDIKVDRPGVRLIYRKGFNGEDPKASDDPQNPNTPLAGPKLMQAAMEGGAPPATQLLFDVHVEPSTTPAKPTDPPVIGTLDPKLAKGPLTRYGFLYLLPVSQIGFEDGPDGTHNGSVEFDVIAFESPDKSSFDVGKQVAMISQTIKLPLTPEEYAQFIKTPFQFFQQLDLPPGKFTLRIGILDSVSNKAGTLEIPLTVQK